MFLRKETPPVYERVVDEGLLDRLPRLLRASSPAVRCGGTGPLIRWLMRFRVMRARSSRRTPLRQLSGRGRHQLALKQGFPSGWMRR